MKWNKLTKPLLVFIFLFGLFWYIRGGLDSKVRVGEAYIGNIRASVTGNVKVYASSTFKLRALTDGMVTHVSLSPMHAPIQVTKEQPLIQLEEAALERALLGLEMEKRHFSERIEVGSLTRMALTVLEKELLAIEELVGAGKEPAFNLELKRSEVQRLRAQVKMEELHTKHFMENNQMKLANLSAELSKRKITSPIDGEFSECYVSPGHIVMSGEIVGVVHSNERMIEVSLNEEDFAGIEVGMPIAVSLFSLADQPILGEVSSLSSSVDMSSGTRKLFAMTQDNIRIPVGSAGRAQVVLQEKADVLLIPAMALLGDSVMVVREGVVEKKKIVTGVRNLKTVEVLGGLKKGDQIILDTPQIYRVGDRVIPVLIDCKN